LTAAVPPHAAPLPQAVPELHAPSRWTVIDLLSDLHLQAGLPRTTAAWARHLRSSPAQAVILLGDIFEVWVGDDAAEPGSFEAACEALLREVARSKTLYFMAGNRDFLVGPDFLARCGIQALADPTVLVAFGQRWLLSHGDALCLDDTDYQAFRRQVRDPAWQQGFLAQPLAQRRELAARMRAASEARKREQGVEGYGDLDLQATLAWLATTRSSALIHGHTHRPADHALPQGAQRHVLSDWDFDTPGPAPRGDVLRLSAEGLRRVPVARPEGA
jgi:UDP-2,3-diacylglucosamine hydrolase